MRCDGNGRASRFRDRRSCHCGHRRFDHDRRPRALRAVPADRWRRRRRARRRRRRRQESSPRSASPMSSSTRSSRAVYFRSRSQAMRYCVRAAAWAARLSALACSKIEKAEWRKTPLSRRPASRSGHRDPVSQTIPPAAATPRLWTRSFRVQSQTERTLASPSRKRTSSRAATRLAAKPTSPRPVMTAPSGGCPVTALQTVLTS